MGFFQFQTTEIKIRVVKLQGQYIGLHIHILAQLFSHVPLFATSWTVAHQTPLSMGFPRQEYWSGLPLPPPGDLPDPEIERASPALAGSLFTTVISGKADILVYYTRNSMSRSSFRYFINQKLNQYYSLKLLFQILCFYFSPVISLTCFPL